MEQYQDVVTVSKTVKTLNISSSTVCDTSQDYKNLEESLCTSARVHYLYCVLVIFRPLRGTAFKTVMIL